MTDKPTQADEKAAGRAFAELAVESSTLAECMMRHRLATEAAKDAEIAELVALLREARCTLSLPTPPIDFKKATITGATMWENERKQQIIRIDAALAKHGGGNE